MHGAPDAWIIERLSFGIQPGRVNHALVEFSGGQTRNGSRLAGSGRVERAGVIHSARQNRGRKLRGKWQEMVDFDAIEVGQAFVPVVRVSLHYPDLVLDPPLRLKGTGTRDVEDLAQIVIMFFQRLLAEDHVPAAGEGGHHEIDGAWRGQFEFDGVLVAGVDLADRPEQRSARDADAGRRFRDAVEGRFYVSRREIRPVVELDALAQVKRVGLGVLGDFPAMRQIGDDGLATVARITPSQVVEHAALSADVADRARLMLVEMRRALENAVAHHPSPLWI